MQALLGFLDAPPTRFEIALVVFVVVLAIVLGTLIVLRKCSEILAISMVNTQRNMAGMMQESEKRLVETKETRRIVDDARIVLEDVSLKLDALLLIDHHSETPHA